MRLLLLLIATSPALGALRINEVADKGTPGFCVTGDWVELYNTGPSQVSLAGHKLCDSDGCGDDDAHSFGASDSIDAAGFHVVCTTGAKARWIGSSDTLTLYDAGGNALDSVVLAGAGAFGKTYARTTDGTGGFAYTWAPTPGAAYAGAGTQTTPSVCDRLAHDGLTSCSSCIAALPAETTCAGTADADFEAEQTALFGNNPRGLWTNTSFLCATPARPRHAPTPPTFHAPHLPRPTRSQLQERQGVEHQADHIR